MTDEELVSELALGSEDALCELLRRYERPLAGFVYRNTGGRDVEDLYQETWARVVRQASRFDSQRRFSTWMFQIALNLCRDWHRRRPPEPVDPAACDAVAAVGMERTEAALDAAAMLALLPEAQREVVTLRYYEDLTEAEVADIVGCPLGTVKSRLHAALARMTAAVRGEAS
ncbi:sigma-70 family RNA polymerase sigma factor [Candidatus Binatia bacterium]|nr:sigma-70 family RNA polymerase sigma factor [Candidatus Binatia bacterium]